MNRKKQFVSLILAAMILMLTACGNTSAGRNTTTNSTNAQNNASDQLSGNEEDTKQIRTGNTLIVYYSYSGTTERVAQELQELTGGTLYELKMEDPYTGDSNTVSDRVFSERDDKHMPELSGELPDISKYDTILIGTPVWNSDMSNPVASYLEQTDFAGKTVAPFWTYITNQGKTAKNFKKRSQNAEVADGLAIRSANGLSDEELDGMLENWLSEING